ncbi:MAG: helix-turn-helix transcriptional regulator [Flavobacteriales bacterium]|nr:helix-turn-helix transcriptional regulator [Flavobacteriales bacterium]
MWNDLLIFDYNEMSSTLLIFFINALVFSVLLFRKGIQEGKKDSKWLSLFIFLGALYICPFMLGYAGWYSDIGYRQFMFFVPFQHLFFIGPAFYFYVKSLLGGDSAQSRRELLHFLPALVYIIYSLLMFVFDKLIFDELYFYGDGRDRELDFWYQFSGFISMLVYLWLSLRAYLKYRRLASRELSFADDVAFVWVKRFCIAFGLVLFIRLLFFVFNPEWGEFGDKYWHYLCFSILLMYISLAGYSNSVKISLSLLTQPGFAEEESEEVELKEDSEADDSLKNWGNTIVQQFEVEAIHKNPYLTLNDLATQLDTNRNVVSKAINQEFKTNFNDFVNGKRVELVIDMLEKGEHQQSTLLGIAFDSGFNSKATFNRAFKKFTGLTPNQYISENGL